MAVSDPQARGPIQRRPQPADVPFSPEMTSADVDGLVQHEIFSKLNPEYRAGPSFRATVQRHSRIVNYRESEIIFREGDWGNTAFFILEGKVAARLDAPRDSPAAHAWQRRKQNFKSLLSNAAQAFRKPRVPEHREATSHTSIGVSAQAEAVTCIHDVPRVLADFESSVIESPELFGELSALGRTARSATVFAVSDTRLLEVRWQGLRDIRRRDKEFSHFIDQSFRQRALTTFLHGSALLGGLRRYLASQVDVDEKAMLEELETAAELLEFGEYDRVGTFKQLASNPIDECVIATEGEYPNGTYLIRSGVARLSRKYHHGRQTVGYLGPGKMFGFEEIVNGRDAHEYSLTAIGYLTAVFIPTDVVLRYIATEPAAPRRRAPSDDAVSSKSSLDPDMLNFLVDEGLVNGTEAMIIDLDRCTRCDDCVRACASTHQNNPRFLRQGPVHQHLMVANACMHCRDPVCMIECPTGAIGRHMDDGTVTINDRTCIGCATCANNCPYEAIRMVEIRDDRGAFVRTKNEEASLDKKTILKATKCDLCVDHFGGPACQRACPHDALVRINLGDADVLSIWLDR